MAHQQKIIVKNTAQEEALVNQYFKEITEIVTLNEREDGIYAKIKKNRDYIKGLNFKEDDVKTNLINSTLQSLIPHVYAKSPEIAVDVNEKLEDKNQLIDYYNSLEFKKGLAKTLEIVLNHAFLETRTKPTFKNSVLSAKVCSIGWVKVHMQNIIGQNPMATTPLADTKDNLHSAHGLEKNLEKDENNDLDKAKLKQTEEGLLETSEIVLSRGLVIDNIDFEDVLVHPAVGRFSNMHKTPRMFQRIWKSKIELQGEFPDVDFSSVVTHEWGKDKKETDYDTKDINTALNKGSHNENPVAVFEVWDKDQNRVHVIVKGVKEILRSWTPKTVGERWYPFFSV